MNRKETEAERQRQLRLLMQCSSATEQAALAKYIQPTPRENLPCESHTVEVNPKPFKRRESEPIHIKHILPAVMRNVKKRMRAARSKK